ncbi:hypothetical protein PGT21_008663 [Puccinia graminis f. sp. tritici]|uniref:Tet-like 2OG-Fe(II) oxygenase domain-containing protein n=1 Tax=Puccinia graminis f. sp. tritici TaxID=56615 RepID=A0A5B0MTD0_PUCGR|nr:hypothetical protein PGT21_008663 [Puccinia graminis f. sp. tritici]
MSQIVSPVQTSELVSSNNRDRVPKRPGTTPTTSTRFISNSSPPPLRTGKLVSLQSTTMDRSIKQPRGKKNPLLELKPSNKKQSITSDLTPSKRPSMTYASAVSGIKQPLDCPSDRLKAPTVPNPTGNQQLTPTTYADAVRSVDTRTNQVIVAKRNKLQPSSKTFGSRSNQPLPSSNSFSSESNQVTVAKKNGLQPSPKTFGLRSNQPSPPSSSSLSELSSTLSNLSSSLSDSSDSISESRIGSTCQDQSSNIGKPGRIPQKRKQVTNLTPHGRKKRNARTTRRRRTKREKKCAEEFTTARPPTQFRIIQKKLRPINLFPDITADFNQRKAEQKQLVEAHKKDPKNIPKPCEKQIFARNPTTEENNLALETVKDSFSFINSKYNKIYDENSSKLVALVEFLKFEDLTEEQWDDLNFLCLFLQDCKEFISPVASKSQKCAGIMWALGWRKDYDGIEILGRYRDKKAIENNPEGFEKVMNRSIRAGEVLWKTFHGFADVAVEKNQKFMEDFNIPSIADNNFPESPGEKYPFGFASNLAFSSHGFYNHHHLDSGDSSELPLAFALIIPTSKLTGKIVNDDYDVTNGQFIFRDLRIALDFKPRTICRMIFRAQEYVHGTLLPTEPTVFTKLGLALQVATRTSNACKLYLNGTFNDDTDIYFGGVDALLEKNE